MVDVPRPEHRCPTHVTMPLSDAVALGRVAEMWASLTPEVRAAEFQTRHGTVSTAVLRAGNVNHQNGTSACCCCPPVHGSCWGGAG